MTSRVHFTLVPGAGGLGSFWDPIAAALPADFSARALDLPGLGHCPARPEIQGYSDLIQHVVTAMPGPGTLAGQSMGGYLSLQVALRHPELVTRLVLIVASAGVNMARQGARDWRIEHRKAHPDAPEWVFEPLPDLTSELTLLRMPVLLIWATRDPICPLAVAEQLLASIPDSRLIQFDTDDHWVARRFAGPVAEAISEWVRAPARSAAGPF
jgi:pimeloyl-ACP methyl ester carboxylesterase